MSRRRIVGSITITWKLEGRRAGRDS